MLASLRTVASLLTAAAAVSLAAPTHAQQPAAQAAIPRLAEIQFPRIDKDPNNAALLYYKVWIDPVFQELKDPCGEQFSGSGPAWKPDATLVKLLNDHQGFIAMLLRATQAPECDFGVEWSQGIGALLPHLGYLRASARILGCDARRCIMERKYDEAAERIAAMYRMSEHISHDGVLISGLVSVAICNLADAQVYAQMSLASITVDGKKMLLEEARKLTKPDAFGIKNGISGERTWTCEWLRGFATGPFAGRIIAEQILPLSQPEAKDGTADAIRKMTEAEVANDLDKCMRFYVDVIQAWDQDDAKDRLKAIEANLERGDYGIVATILCPALNKCYISDTKARTEHAQLIDRLNGFIALSK